MLCEMQSVSSRIWTRVAVFISSDDNHYTTGNNLKHLTVFKQIISYSFKNNITHKLFT